MSHLDHELEFAGALAREAGRLALDFFQAGVTPEYKSGHEPVTAADRALNELIVDGISRRFPDDAILAEESPPDPRRFHASRTWMVDPIDGTQEFVTGTHGWEVLIGLVQDALPVLGVIYHPLSDTLTVASQGAGTWMTASGTRRRIQVARPPGSPVVIALRNRNVNDLVGRIIDALGRGEVVAEGGFGARVLLALESKADIVLSVGGHPREWDTCATEIVLREAGIDMRNCLGEALRYLKPDPVQPDGLVIARSEIIRSVLEVVVPLYAEHHKKQGDEGRPRSAG